jgi:DNA-directed RNA polymerase sigma subunit (sigma70/sigma32)
MADIGKSMGLSRERVRQIEVGALVRLRHSI